MCFFWNGETGDLAYVCPLDIQLDLSLCIRGSYTLLGKLSDVKLELLALRDGKGYVIEIVEAVGSPFGDGRNVASRRRAIKLSLL